MEKIHSKTFACSHHQLLVHKIGKIYVNIKTKEVSFEINRKQEAALTKNSGSAYKYFMEKPAFERLKQILKDRKKEAFEASKFDQKTATEAIQNQLEKLEKLLSKK